MSKSNQERHDANAGIDQAGTLPPATSGANPNASGSDPGSDVSVMSVSTDAMPSEGSVSGESESSGPGWSFNNPVNRFPGLNIPGLGGGTVTIADPGTGGTGTATLDPELTISGPGSGTFQIKAEPNTGTAPRDAVITVRTTDGRLQAEVRVTQLAASTGNNRRIVLDPGHHIGRSNAGYEIKNKEQYWEHEGMWKLTNKIKEELSNRGYENIILTRGENDAVNLTARGEMATGADLFLSLHSNASPADTYGQARGVECFYSLHIPDDRVFAAALSKAVSQVMGNPDRGAKINESIDYPGQDFFTVINRAQKVGCPHVLLLESGFHDNAIDVTFLLDDDNLQLIAVAVAEVITEFIN